MAGKYTAQTLRAAAAIRRKGTVCTWYKAADDSATDPTPEFPTLADPTAYPKIPILFYPSASLRYQTLMEMKQTEMTSISLFAIVAGNVKFQPARGDKVEITLPDKTVQTLEVDVINVVQPDLYPIVYEIVFK